MAFSLHGRPTSAIRSQIMSPSHWLKLALGVLHRVSARYFILFAVLGAVVIALSRPDKHEQWPCRLLVHHKHGIRALAFSSDGATLATGSGWFDTPGELKLWDVHTGIERAT